MKNIKKITVSHPQKIVDQAITVSRLKKNINVI
jgi:transcriptional regulator of met regulon